jgi:hypothetical protein
MEITAEYQEMRRRNLCQDEYATFAKENVFKGPRRAGQPVQDERFRIERMVNPSLQLDRSGTWEKPPRHPSTTSADETPEEPCAGGSSSEWCWDVRSDCSYWLSLQGFNPKWLFQVKDVAYLKDGIVGGCAIRAVLHQDCVIAQRDGQDVGDGAEDGQLFFAEEVDRA